MTPDQIRELMTLYLNEERKPDFGDEQEWLHAIAANFIIHEGRAVTERELQPLFEWVAETIARVNIMWLVATGCFRIGCESDKIGFATSPYASADFQAGDVEFTRIEPEDISRDET